MNGRVLITGAGSGIGAACTRALATAGWRVALTGRRAEPLEAVAAGLPDARSRLLVLPGDLTRVEDRQRWLATVDQAWGGLDGLVNNAGYGTRGPLEAVPLDAIRANFETNVFALLGLVQAVLPAWRARRSGRIVNIGSVAGRIARGRTAVYDATKHALEAFNDGLRQELRPFGIHVSLVRPGFIRTDFLPAAEAASRAVPVLPGDPYGQAQPGAGDAARFRRFQRLAAPPERVAHLVVHALGSRRPRPHYATPRHARLLLFLRWLLPTGTIDALAAR